MKTLNIQRKVSRIDLLTGGAIAVMFALAPFGIQSAFAAISSQLKIKGQAKIKGQK